jgi:sugar phosphate isomerase/epimerase
MSDSAAFPPLPGWKKRFPFPLGVTSFVHPAGYLANVRALAPAADHIQLLFFESRGPDALPSPADVALMAELGRGHGTAFTLHLPLDRTLDHGPAPERRELKEFILRLLDLAAPLAPVAAILHLAGPGADSDPRRVAAWQERTAHDLDWLAARTRRGPRLCLENTDFPCAWLMPLCRPLAATLCLDVGHLGLAGADPAETLCRLLPACGAIHLHAWQNGRDHLPLDLLPADTLQDLGSVLRGFSGLVTLELFNHEAVCRSLRSLSACLNIPIPG